MSSSDEKQSAQSSTLPDGGDVKKMVGPVVKWTVADIFSGNNYSAIAYHCAKVGYDILTPVGAVIGGAISMFRGKQPVLQMMGKGGLYAGGAGAVLGLAGMGAIAWKGEAATPPWNEEGIQQRVRKLERNFMVRVFDLSVWSGIGLGTGAVLVAGGPARLGLASGTFGVMQALSLGSTAGSIGAFTCIASVQKH